MASVGKQRAAGSDACASLHPRPHSILRRRGDVRGPGGAVAPAGTIRLFGRNQSPELALAPA